MKTDILGFWYLYKYKDIKASEKLSSNNVVNSSCIFSFHQTAENVLWATAQFSALGSSALTNFELPRRKLYFLGFAFM